MLKVFYFSDLNLPDDLFAHYFVVMAQARVPIGGCWRRVKSLQLRKVDRGDGGAMAVIHVTANVLRCHGCQHHQSGV